MSGYFVQRGGAAVMPPAKRAQIAAECGVDLVLELPVMYSTASADFFALGAVKVMRELGTEIILSFGSETGDKEELINASKLIADNQNEMYSLIRKFMSEGESMPRARESALKILGAGETGFLKGSNNILAIEYIKHCRKILGDRCEFLVIKREGAGYHDLTEGKFMSATGIRMHMRSDISNWKKAVPEATKKMIEQEKVKYSDEMFSMIRSAVIREGRGIEVYRDVIEGLENRIFKNISIAEDYEQMVTMTCTKRYTRSAIQRALLSILLAITKEEFSRDIPVRLPYLRILASGDNGYALLRRLKKTSKAPFIEKGKKFPWREWYGSNMTIERHMRLEKRAAMLYGMIPDEC